MQTETITAAQIHEDFYGAEERLFVEAIGFSKGVLNLHANKADRLKKIGFRMAKPIKDAEEYNKKKGISENMIAAIEYFRIHYPQYKFITEAEVKRLCEKYGLLLGDAHSFVGDMPEKNLVDIEKFKLRKEDWKEKSPRLTNFGMMIPQGSSQLNRWGEPEPIGMYQGRGRQTGYLSTSDLIDEYYRQKQATIGISQERSGNYYAGIDPYNAKKKKEVEKEQPPFKICAPKEDFNTLGYEIKDGYRLVWDPVVLQPVSKNDIEGYLIVTAWGDEASDELVVNQTQN